MFDKDNFWVGLVFGVCVPFVGYAILLSVWEFLDAQGITNNIGMAENFRMRTIAVLAICFNLIPIQIFKKRYNFNSMRGIAIATSMYVVAWLFYFGNSLFA